ncbi:MAG: hypothetical protein PWP70_1235 [Moorella sp. (in: firmicutes)]|nr:hypothetical protein [Moorella sp. (in: firmicutes)]
MSFTICISGVSDLKNVEFACNVGFTVWNLIAKNSSDVHHTLKSPGTGLLVLIVFFSLQVLMHQVQGLAEALEVDDLPFP